ncbi:metalloregulator ArsR/SmtB family transcription factor [Salinibacterium sp. ZJ450]|uniref:metalloregulator ArsR/SmtB family transcription factor n=1 Tax=Salinibacterium sp. ZJ450 TaxID=2708338 RepID=UPI001CD77C91|nr:metalloregulator ArsR/SmtB family transcription factor [Salinibacterium sp. ZJ450]
MPDAIGVRDLAATPPAMDREDAERLAHTLRMVADPTRLQVLSVIIGSPNGEALVGNLAVELGITQPTVSHHVKVMAEEGLLQRDRRGRQVWYSIVPSRRAEIVERVFGAITRQPDEVRAQLTRLILPGTGTGTESESTDVHRDLPPALTRVIDDLAVRFSGVFSPQTISRYVGESYALLSERAGVSERLPSLSAQFATDRLTALAAAEALVPRGIPEVLFVCVQNAGRSQMAAAFLRALGGDRVHVRTAGSEPAASVHPVVVDALDEVGVPLAADFPKPLTDEVVRAADYVITMGCGDACPVYPGRRYLDWELDDPVGQPLAKVRDIRDDIERRVRALLAELI